MSQDGDVYACVADCGWITGHTYIVYGPLCNGATTVMFESIPTYPNPYRYWDLVQRHKVTQFYTAPTAGTYVTMYNILIMITAFAILFRSIRLESMIMIAMMKCRRN